MVLANHIHFIIAVWLFVSPFAGFDIDRSQQKLHELYDKLPHNADGSIKIKKKESYSVRTGLTQPPMFLVLDVTQVSVPVVYIFQLDQTYVFALMIPFLF